MTGTYEKWPGSADTPRARHQEVSPDALLTVQPSAGPLMAAEKTRRTYGTGSLFEKTDGGRVSYYGQWRTTGVQIKRKIGPKRVEGSSEGLSKTEAEKQLRKLMGDVKPAPRAPVHEMTIGEVGERYLVHLEKMKGRKKSTRTAVESTLRVHLEPYFRERGIAKITREEVEDLRTVLEGKVGPKSVRNYMGTLSAIFKFAMNPSRRWANVNPCDGVELPGGPARRRDPLPAAGAGAGADRPRAARTVRGDRPCDVPDRGDDRDARGGADRCPLE